VSTTTARHWASIGEATFVAGIRLLWGVHRVFGRTPFRLCVYPVVAWYWATSALARRSSLQYLQRLQAAHGTLGREPGWRDTLRHFLSFAETLLDKLLAISGRYPFDELRVEGREALDELLRGGRGALIVTAHVGCLELCRALADRRSGQALTVLVHTAHAPRFNRLLKRLDPHSAVELLQVTEMDAAGAVLLSERIERGALVAIVGDRVPVRLSKTVQVPFLGVPAPFPQGAYVLASLLRCPLYFMGCVRVAGGRHLVRFECLAERVELPRGRREQAVAALAGRYVERLEALLQRSPFDWFNFFPFWDQTSP